MKRKAQKNPLVPEPAPPLSVLVVDDEAALRKMALRALRRLLPRAKLYEAADGVEAGKKIAGLHPALVILDLMLPGTDGVTVCALVKGDGRLKATRIIAMSGADPQKARFDILSVGADGFLPKPFRPEDLASEVRRLLPEAFAA